MNITKDQKEGIVEALVLYSSETFTDMTWHKTNLTRLVYSVIVQGIADLHGNDSVEQKEAEAYFKGTQYLWHCEQVGIDENLLNLIVYAPEKYLQQIGLYDQEENEDWML